VSCWRNLRSCINRRWICVLASGNRSQGHSAPAKVIEIVCVRVVRKDNPLSKTRVSGGVRLRCLDSSSRVPRRFGCGLIRRNCSCGLGATSIWPIGTKSQGLRFQRVGRLNLQSRNIFGQEGSPRRGLAGLKHFSEPGISRSGRVHWVNGRQPHAAEGFLRQAHLAYLSL
jgi:hypothetical protein